MHITLIAGEVSTSKAVACGLLSGFPAGHFRLYAGVQRSSTAERDKHVIAVDSCNRVLLYVAHLLLGLQCMCSNH